MQLDAPVRRTLTVLETELPAMLDEVQAEPVVPSPTWIAWDIGGRNGTEPDSGDTHLDEIGPLADPVTYRRLTDDFPEDEWPAVFVEMEGAVDAIPWASEHQQLEYPLAIHVVGWFEDSPAPADHVAWLYGEAVRRVVRRKLPDNIIIDMVDRDTVTVEVQPWGESFHGRDTIVRVSVLKFAAYAPRD